MFKTTRKCTIVRHFEAITVVILGLIIAGGIIAGCNFTTGNVPEQSARETQLKETELDINVKQTLMAQQGSQQTAEAPSVAQITLEAQQTSLAQGDTIATSQLPTIDPNLAARQTVDAQLATQAAQMTANAPEPPTKTPEPTQTPDIKELMKSANILLYEDMTNYLDINRYVKDTLNAMNLTYKDDGSAKGWLKSDLLGGAPNGEPWDLIIIAAEAKSGVSGEFFEYVLDALEQGSSVIMEVWYLDSTYNGTASALLARCGIEFQADWRKIPPARMVMFPLKSHPILQEPNSGITLTDVTSYWWDPNGQIEYNIGDLVKLSPGSDAELLVGTVATNKSTHGTVTSCMGGQLILQTFSSHQLTFDAMKPLWENYIYNALKTHFLDTH